MTTQIKKAFEEIYVVLEANSNKKVSTILPELMELMTAKSTSKAFHKDEDGNVVAIYCYYHKKWELVSEVEYGSKKSTAHGLNTMCKEGANQWSKQQRVAKKAKEDLLEAVARGEVEDIASSLDAIEQARCEVTEASDPHGSFDTLEEALAF